MSGVIGKFRDNFELTRAKMRAGALVGVLGFPAYFYIWAHMYPQDYENAELRLLCVTLLLLWLACDRLFHNRSWFFLALSYVTLIICLPFFFGYMFMENNASAVWLGSLICSMLYLAVAVEITNFFCMFLVGLVGAAVLYSVSSDTPFDSFAFQEAMPVILFALGGGLILKFAEEWTIRSNQKKAIALASSIAHELRTPLLGVRLELDHFSSLCDPNTRSLQPEALSVQHEAISERVKRHVQKASHIIDCLLLNVREESFDNSGFNQHSMQQVLDDVLARYPLTETERTLIKVHREEDFIFWGDDLLMAHVLMNLLKNAFAAVAAAEKGTVEVYFSRVKEKNIMCVRDTGRGIASVNREKIFERFYTDTSGGAGLGLAFCKRVVESFGGDVECYSEAGKYTEFRVLLPAGESL